MNRSRSNKSTMDTSSGCIKLTKIHEGSAFQTSNDVHCNFAMRSFFQKMARDNRVRSFTLVSDNAALPPRNDMRRNSAPPVINGATRKMLYSYDEAPSCPMRRSSSRDFSEDRPRGLFLETIFDEVLDAVLDEGGSILHEVDECEQDDENESNTSSCSQPSASAPSLLHELQEEPDFDSTFQRFTVNPSVGEYPESNTTAFTSPGVVAPRLPVRRESVDETFGCLMEDSTLETTSMSPSQPKASPPPPPESLDAQSWHHQEKAPEYQCQPSAPTTTRYIMDMQSMNDVIAESTTYGRRRRSSRRSSLDTGITFRDSFSSSQNSEEDISP